MKLPILCVAMAGLAVSANATTYVGSEAFSGASVSLSVSTDGILGAVSQSDITGWNLNITDGAGSVNMNPGNSGLLLLIGGLTATQTALSFDFTGGGAFLFEKTSIGDGGPFWCAAAIAGCGGGGNAIAVSTQWGENPIEQNFLAGEVVLATAVPEAATWSMMMLGVGGLGASLRARRSRVTVKA